MRKVEKSRGGGEKKKKRQGGGNGPIDAWKMII